MPEFIADLHLHSRFSRATARTCDLHHFALWARKKGVSVVATGDVTHPGWRDEVRGQLVEVDGGTFQLRDELWAAVEEELHPSCCGPVRFVLSVEISTSYKRGERTWS